MRSSSVTSPGSGLGAPTRLNQIRALWKPALSAFSMNLSSALGLQGVILAIGAAISPAAAGAFGAARLVSRVPLQLIAMASRASAPELTRLHAQKNVVSRDQLFLLNVAVALLVAVPAALLLIFAGPWAVDTISHGQLQVSTVLFIALAGAVALQSVWMVGADFLWAINRQGITAYVYLLATATMVLGPFLVSAPHALEKAAGLMVLGEIAMLAGVVSVCLRATGLNAGSALAATRSGRVNISHKLVRLFLKGPR